MLEIGENTRVGMNVDNIIYKRLESLSTQKEHENFRAIDWVSEYSKERRRQQTLSAQATGFYGRLKKALDASEVWIILIVTGFACGVLAGGIDVISDWLADLKSGYCTSVTGSGKFYLNKSFCCWGYEEFRLCHEWKGWDEFAKLSSTSLRWILQYGVFITFSILYAISSTFLVVNYSPYAKHSGIPEIKTVLGGFVIRHFMGFWTLNIKCLGLSLAVASGLWLGKEGPLVHVACCCANVLVGLSRVLSTNEARRREILSAAAAAGISVAFGSPIGGVLFSLEQLSYYFPDKTMWQSFVCAMVAAVTLQAFNPFRTGKLVLYQVTYHSGWKPFEMVPFAVIGLLGGLYGGLLIQMNMYIARWRQMSRISIYPVTEVFIISLVTSIISFPNNFMRAQSSELLYNLFAECSDISDDQLGLCKSGTANSGVILLLMIASLFGTILTSITFGATIPAGIILPSMTLGALYGRAIGLLFEHWQQTYPNFILFEGCEPDIPCITPGTYAIIGAAASLGGVTRMTVSIVVIMFELTGALTYVLPIMIAVMIGKWVGDALSRASIYESWIQFNGYPFLENWEDNSNIPDVALTQVMTRIEDLVIITSTGHTIQSLEALIEAHPYRGFPVVNNSTELLLLGYIARSDLACALMESTPGAEQLLPGIEVYFCRRPASDAVATLDLRPWVDRTPITLNTSASLLLTARVFQSLGVRFVLFIEKGSVKGLMTKKDVWYYTNSGARYESPTQNSGIFASARQRNNAENSL